MSKATPTDQDYAALLLDLFATSPAGPDAVIESVVNSEEPARRVSTRAKRATAKAAKLAADQQKTTAPQSSQKRKRDSTTPQAAPLGSTIPRTASTSTVKQEQEQYRPPQGEQETPQYPLPKRRKKGSVKRTDVPKYSTSKKKLWRATGMPVDEPLKITSREAGYDVPASLSGRPRKSDISAAEEEKRRLVLEAIEEGALDDGEKETTADIGTETTTSALKPKEASIRGLIEEGQLEEPAVTPEDATPLGQSTTPARSTPGTYANKGNLAPTRRSARRTKPGEHSSDVDSNELAGSIRIGESATPEANQKPGFVASTEKRWLGWNNTYWPLHFDQKKKMLQAQQEASPELQLLTEATQAEFSLSPSHTLPSYLLQFEVLAYSESESIIENGVRCVPSIQQIQAKFGREITPRILRQWRSPDHRAKIFRLAASFMSSRSDNPKHRVELQQFFTESPPTVGRHQSNGRLSKEIWNISHAARYKYAVIWYMINKIGPPRNVRGIPTNELTAKEVREWLSADGAGFDGGSGLASKLHAWQNLKCWKAIVELARKESRWMGEVWLGDGEEPEPEVRPA